MRTSAQFRTALTALLLFVAPAASQAVRGPMRSVASSTTAPDDGRIIAADGRALRSTISLTSLSTLTMTSARQVGGPRLRALQTFEQALGATSMMWDETTGVPLRMVGAGVPVANAMRDPNAAETAARAFLQRHLATLAPGASVDDFTLITNSLNGAGDLRTVAFAQAAEGLPVVGGAVFVSFKADRLFTAGSTALPNIHVDGNAARAANGNRDPHAVAAWLLASSGVRATVNAPARRVVLPLITNSGPIDYVVADEQLASGALGARWRVWSDPRTGAPIARRSLRISGQGIVAFDVPKRSPLFGHEPRPAPFANHIVNGQAVTANIAGSIMWTGSTGTLMPSVNGSLVSVSNFQGAPVTASLPLVDAGTTVWTSTVEAEQAQLAGYVAATNAKLFAKQFLNPSLPYLDQVLSVVVNEGNGGPGEDCNAYSTGDDIHFLPRSERCENTALLADVVHHEFGHSLHFNSLTAGVGDFDSAASEALSDFLALSMSEDPALGLGFFVTRPDIAVRNLDPAYIEKRAPDDLVDEPHADGEILVGALWDMRKALIARLGKEAGTARALKIFYGIMQRGIGIFTSYNEALVADDDNGNLADGTPNQCAITTAFAHHGLTGGQPLALPTAPPPTRNGFVVETTLTPGGAAAGCANAKVVDGEVSWKIRGKTGDGSQGTLPITATANGTMASATLPTQPAGTVLQYQMRIALDDGTTLRFPDNAADPFYEFYVGDAKPIWCAEFEGADAPAVTMTGDWMTGKPMGPGAGNVGGDPAAAFGGTGVLGNNLQGGGLHAPGATAIATLPSVALAGYRNVRLQFRRWLNVDDASFDQASVRINGAAAFANPARNATSELEKFLVAPRVFRDREWREVDFDLGDPASGLDTSKISLELKSDSSNELGGWNVDHLCIVGVASVCGDGIVDATEACDDGNTLDDEQCMATCQLPTQADGGCCSATGSGATGPALLAFATLGFVGLSARRRRQR